MITDFQYWSYVVFSWDAMIFLGIICIIIMQILTRRLDRYRLKYGFDKELESIDAKDANRLANREKRFNERMAKYGEKKYGAKK